VTRDYLCCWHRTIVFFSKGLHVFTTQSSKIIYIDTTILLTNGVYFLYITFMITYNDPSSLAKGYDPLYSSARVTIRSTHREMSRADRNPWLAKMIKTLPLCYSSNCIDGHLRIFNHVYFFLYFVRLRFICNWK
jgi:hypothetical protein